MGYLGTQILAALTVLQNILADVPWIGEIHIEVCAAISCAVLVFYCATGGIIASIYVDLIQRITMMVAAFMVFAAAVAIADDGITEMSRTIVANDPESMSPWGLRVWSDVCSLYFVEGLKFLSLTTIRPISKLTRSLTPRLLFVVLLATLAFVASSPVWSASYQEIDGRIVDPSKHGWDGDHAYARNNLEPNANLRHAYLAGAALAEANLREAYLTGSYLTDVKNWEDAYWADAYYYTDNLPRWQSDMDQAWRDSAGILAIDPVSGDINGDGVFDAADYTVWQDNAPDGPVWEWEIDYWIDYRTWKDNFGQSSASGSGADHVPEPTTPPVGPLGPGSRTASSAVRVRLCAP